MITLFCVESRVRLPLTTSSFGSANNLQRDMNQRVLGKSVTVRTAMIIDDDHAFVRHMTRFVERFCGLSVIDTAPSAEAALQRIGSGRPSIVLLDICMSGMSGLDAIALLMAASPSSRILVVSSMPSEYARKAFELGASGYVKKDRIVEDLPALIARYL